MNYRHQLFTAAAARGSKQRSGLRRIACLAALLVIFVASGVRAVPVSESTFPDANFRSALISKGYAMFTGSLYETLPVTAMNVKSCNISDLTGIVYFPTLNTLDCSSNKLSSLILTGNTLLQTLDCSNNNLSSVNLSQNALLTTLTIYKNKLRGSSMDTFIQNLFDRSKQATKGELRIIYNEYASTGNKMTSAQVEAAKKRGWTPKMSTNGTTWTDYPGSDAIAINATNFPDANFREWLLEQSYGMDGYLSTPEIAAVTGIDVSNKSISSLKGIEYFTALKELNCYNNGLTELDVSKNTALTKLNCRDNQLTSLDVSGCTKLESLYCDFNNLTTLDVSKNTALKELYCYYNDLTELDVSKNTALKELYCECNQLASLNVSGCTALTVLSCGWNQLTSLDVSKNTALDALRCNNNQLTSLNVSGCTALTVLSCGENKLTTLDVTNCTALTTLECYINQLTSLDVTNCTALTWLSCVKNQLTSLDVTNCTALTELKCYQNQLTTLDVSGCTALTFLVCYSNQIRGVAMTELIESLPDRESAFKGDLWVYDNETPAGNMMTKVQVKIATDKNWNVQMWDEEEYGWVPYEGETPDGIEISEANFPDDNFRAYVSAKSIDKDEDGYLSPAEIAKVTTISVARKEIKSLKGIEYFTALTSLHCENNQLTELDVSNNTNLGYLICESNQLTELDVSNNTALVSLWCGSNPLVTLDVSKNTALTSLSCHSNGLTTLDVSNNTALTTLYCHMNQLSVLNVSNNTELERLSCYDNQLTELDISKNTKLTRMECYSNQLTSLDASGCSALTELYCSTNQLTSLNVSGCTALTELSCHENNIRGAAMNEFVNSLPTADAIMRVYYPGKARNNVITKVQVEIAKSKHWQVLAVFDGDYPGVTIPGDANGDGVVDAQDIATVRDYILGRDPQPFSLESADLDESGTVDIVDLTQLIEKLK